MICGAAVERGVWPHPVVVLPAARRAFPNLAQGQPYGSTRIWSGSWMAISARPWYTVMGP